MKIHGKALTYGDDVNTDVIFPARYMSLSLPEDLALHCMEDIDRDFASSHSAGDLIVAGDNFGCGSSREHAPISIKASGISCVIAKKFARIFYRNSINIGLPIIECEEAVNGINKGDIVEVEVDTGKILNVTTGKSYFGQPFPEFIKNMINTGGLLNSIK